MEVLFWEAVRQYGLPVGLLLVAVLGLAKALSVKDKALTARYEKRETELTVERDFYRSKWIETLDAAEVGEQAAKRLAGGRRRTGAS